MAGDPDHPPSESDPADLAEQISALPTDLMWDRLEEVSAGPVAISSSEHSNKPDHCAETSFRKVSRESGPAAPVYKWDMSLVLSVLTSNACTHLSVMQVMAKCK